MISISWPQHITMFQLWPQQNSRTDFLHHFQPKFDAFNKYSTLNKLNEIGTITFVYFLNLK